MLTNTAPNLTFQTMTTNWQATASSLTDGAIQMMTARRDGRAGGAQQSFRRPSPPPAASIEPVPRPLTCVTVVRLVYVCKTIPTVTTKCMPFKDYIIYACIKTYRYFS